MRRYVIANPLAGNGRSLKTTNFLVEQFPDLGRDHVVLCPTPQDVRLQTRKALEDGAQQIIAVGGDGTICQAASAFFLQERNLFPQASLACVPAGTGCDFFKSIAGKEDPVKIIREGYKKPIDMVFLDIDGQSLYSINTISLGITTSIVSKKEHLPKWIPSRFSYTIPTLAVIGKMRSQNLQISVDGTSISGDFLAILMNKGYYGGGGMKLGEPNFHDSGKIAVSIAAAPIGIFKFLVNILKLYHSGLRSLSFIRTLEGCNIKFQLPQQQFIEIDGDLHQGRNVSMYPLRKALHVHVPKP